MSSFLAKGPNVAASQYRCKPQTRAIPIGAPTELVGDVMRSLKRIVPVSLCLMSALVLTACERSDNTVAKVQPASQTKSETKAAPAKTEPATADPTKPAPAKIEPTKVEPIKTESTRSQDVKTPSAPVSADPRSAA